MSVDIGFYHCRRQPAQAVATRLAARVVESGKRLMMVAGRDVLETLDTALWTDDPDSFLAHGFAGNEDSPHQPILLAEEAQAENGAPYLMLVGAPLPADVTRFERVFLLFDEGSTAHQRARDDWRGLNNQDNLSRSYWQQKAGGGWEKKG